VIEEPLIDETLDEEEDDTYYYTSTFNPVFYNYADTYEEFCDTEQGLYFKHCEQSDDWETYCPTALNVGYPDSCVDCIEEKYESSDAECPIKWWENTHIAENICSNDTVANLNSTEIEEAKVSNPNCTENCAVCEAHWDCFSGCCGAVEPDGLKRCREHCYDEFERPLFSDSNESIKNFFRCRWTDEMQADLEVVAGAAAGGFVLLAVCT
jgi:hypothetical protein